MKTRLGAQVKVVGLHNCRTNDGTVASKINIIDICIIISRDNTTVRVLCMSLYLLPLIW